MRRHWTRYALMFLVIAPIAISVFGFVVMALWNWLVPALFGGPVITFWQAWGLLLLSKILFGSFQHGQQGESRRLWRRRMLERWEKMTPEERDQLRQELGSRCGPFKAPANRPAEVRPEP
jgi:hypothetical protein